MLKVTTRLFATGVLAATLAAVNAGAYAAETKSEEIGDCHMKTASVAAEKCTSAKVSAKTASAKASCCSKPVATKVASAAVVKAKAASTAPSCCQKPAAVKAATKTVVKKAIKS